MNLHIHKANAFWLMIWNDMRSILLLPSSAVAFLLVALYTILIASPNSMAVLDAFGSYFPTDMIYGPDFGHLVAFSRFFWMLNILFTVFVWRTVIARQKRCPFLLVPASRTVKWFSRWLLSGVVIPLILILIYFMVLSPLFISPAYERLVPKPATSITIWTPWVWQQWVLFLPVHALLFWSAIRLPYLPIMGVLVFGMVLGFLVNIDGPQPPSSVPGQVWFADPGQLLLGMPYPSNTWILLAYLAPLLTLLFWRLSWLALAEKQLGS